MLLLCIASPKADQLLIRKFDIIPVLTDIAKAAVKEKVIRIVIATFRASSGYSRIT